VNHGRHISRKAAGGLRQSSPASLADPTPDNDREERPVGLGTSRRDLLFSLWAGSLDATFPDGCLPESESPNFFSAQRRGFRPGVEHVSRLTGVTGSDSDTNGGAGVVKDESQGVSQRRGEFKWGKSRRDRSRRARVRHLPD